MNDELDGICHGLIEVLPGTEENHKSSARIVSATAEIWTKHLSNRNIKHYCYTNLFGDNLKTQE
jgi:hypothetical protein